MNANTDAAITFSFTGFAARGGRTAEHVDGWGMAFYERSGCRVFHDDQPASESPLAEFLSRHPIKSRIVIAHLRRATQGEVTLANCHPFQREWLGQTWLFANNGHLNGFDPPLQGPHRPAGTTDSERAFCWMLGQLRARFADREQPPPWQELAPHVAELSGEIARHGNFNFLLTNGEALYTHCSTRLQVLQRRHPFPRARLVDCDLSLDLSAMNGPNDRIVIVATEPLTTEEVWQR
jgi:glutamine amidotransferase